MSNTKERTGLVSAIIPVYNTENYLRKCIESVLAQTYGNTEIILVDDASSDGSGKICDELAEKYSNIQSYHNENNKGQSFARNFGVKKCKGEYVCFVDSDDYISENMIASLINGCKKYDAEIGCTNKVRVSANGKELFEKVCGDKDVIGPEEAMRFLLLRYDPSPCNKLYRRSLFDKISFPEGVIYEDIMTIPRVIDACKKIYHDKGYGYYYVQQEKSTIHSKFDKKKINAYHAARWLYEFVLKKYPSLKLEAERFYILSLTTAITDIYGERDKYKKEYAELLEQLSSFKNEYQKNPYISFPKKIMISMDLNGMVSLVNAIKKARRGGQFN